MAQTQNFSNQKLRGRSFKGQDLAGVNFNGADICGADFSHSNLTGANFISAKTGQQLHTFGLHLVTLICLILLSGLISGYAGGLIGHLLFGKDSSASHDQPIFFVLSGILSLIVLAVFIAVAIRKSLGTAFGGLSFIIAITISAAAVIGSAESEALVASVLQLLVLAAAIAGTLVGAIVIAAGLISSGLKSFLFIGTIFIVSAIPGALEGVELEKVPPTLRGVALLTASVVALGILGLSLYIGRSAIAQRDNRYAAIQKISLVLASFGGTRFCHANLTDADFTDANLNHADLRTAKLQRTCWLRARQLHCARLEGTYLENPAIRYLVITKNGQNQNYDHLNLRGINLQNANLCDVSFIGADLSGSTLQKADLSRARLVKTQLYGVNLGRACLTGAFIQDWAISIDTQFTDVECQYIYMRQPTQEDPFACRKPDNEDEVFEEGDFADFITPIVKTLNLYQQQNVDLRTVAANYNTIDLFHHDGIDPSAAAVALQRLAEQHPDAHLEVVALEGRGNQKVRLQAVVSSEVNPSELSAQYSENYDQLKSLPYGSLQDLLEGFAERDQQMMQQFVEAIRTAIQQPKVYMEIGELIMSQSKGNINIGDIQGNISGLAAAGETQTIQGSALGEISGTVTNTINQLADSESPGEVNLKELLTQLQSAIEKESELSEEDKEEALAQVNTLAKAGQTPKDGAIKKAAKTAMKILKGTAASLPDATKLVEEFNKLLPAISSLLLLL